MTFQQIIADIKKGNFKPIYLLMGEESYFIDAITNLLEKKVLKEEEKAFNQTILYGKDTDVQTVIGEAKRFPMMSEHTLVLVKEAQHLRDWDKLESYVQNPQSTTVLVFAHKYKKLDKRKKVAKLLDNQGMLFTSNKLYDNQIPNWIEQHLHSRGYAVSPKATLLLAESLGNDLARVANELEKLELIVEKGEIINDVHVEQNVGISKDYNNFELQKAIGDKNFAKALKIQKYFASNPNDHPLVLTVSVLYRFFSLIMLVHHSKDKNERSIAAKLKVSPYFVNDYIKAANVYSTKKCARVIGYLRETDLKSKGVDNASTPHSELLKELIFKIFYV